MREWHRRGGKQTRKPEYLSKQHARQRTAKRERKLQLVALKGGHCVDCGFAGHVAALEFDHRDPSTKVTEITTLLGHKWETIMAEVEKCDLVCSNCHRIRTWNRWTEHLK